MPDTKFSFKSLKEHIRKYLWVYIVGTIVCLMGSDILWTMTRPRTPDEQLVEIYLLTEYSDPSGLEVYKDDLLARGQAYDPALLEVELLNLQYSDPETDYYGPMVLMARLSTGEADVFLCSRKGLEGLMGNGVVLPLDAYYAEGMFDGLGLEPYYDKVLINEETQETETQLLGFKLDSVTALRDKGIMANEDCFLVFASNGTNIETSMKVAEYLIQDLMAEQSQTGEAAQDVPADTEGAA